MKKKQNFLKLLVILSVSIVSCQHLRQPPQIEECVLAVKAKKCICIDLRRSDEPYIKPLEYCEDYMCTSPDDYAALDAFFTEALEDLAKCEARSENANAK